MEIPLDAQVECTDGVCGHSAFVLVNPVLDEVTHLVVREDSSSTEYIVPVDVVSETIAGTIQLRCSKVQLEQMDPFIKTEFVEEKVPESFIGYGDGMNGAGSQRMSSMSSMPTLRRTPSGATPAAFWSASESWLCVVVRA